MITSDDVNDVPKYEKVHKGKYADCSICHEEGKEKKGKGEEEDKKKPVEPIDYVYVTTYRLSDLNHTARCDYSMCDQKAYYELHASGKKVIEEIVVHSCRAHKQEGASFALTQFQQEYGGRKKERVKE